MMNHQSLVAQILFVVGILTIICFVDSTDYLDHVSCNTVNVALKGISNDAIYSLDSNTRIVMQSDGNLVLSSRIDSMSNWIIKWQTNSYQDIATSSKPIFVIQRDGNLVVYSDDKGWQANIAKSPQNTYHFVVSNGGYAYLMDNTQSVDWITNSSITSYPTYNVLPTQFPTQSPTVTSTMHPFKNPTINPSKYPTKTPTKNPTRYPTTNPSKTPTINPSENPTMTPSQNPSTKSPSSNPTKVPSFSPTMNPSNYPTKDPSNFPTLNPSNSPTMNPSNHPSTNPSHSPTKNPFNFPTNHPTLQPSINPITNTQNDGEAEYSQSTESTQININTQPAKTQKQNDYLYVDITLGVIICILICICCILMKILSNKKKNREKIKEQNIELGEVNKAQKDLEFNHIVSLTPINSNTGEPGDDDDTGTGSIYDKCTQSITPGPPPGHVTAGNHDNQIFGNDEDDSPGTGNTGIATNTESTGTGENEESDDDMYNEYGGNNNNGVTIRYKESELEVKNWLETSVGLTQYFHNFIKNGYESLELVKEIPNTKILELIGISLIEHQTKIMLEIATLRYGKNAWIPHQVNHDFHVSLGIGHNENDTDDTKGNDKIMITNDV